MSAPAREPDATAAPRPSPSLVRVWAGVLLAPAAWALDFLARTMFGRFASVHDVRWPLRAMTAVSVALLLLGAWLCWRERRRETRDGDGDGPDGEATARKTRAALAAWGLALAAFFLLLVLAQAYPAFVLSAREIT